MGALVDAHRDGECGDHCTICAQEPTDFLVTWEINIEARSPREAAEVALQIQRDRTSGATCFTVDGESIDLGED